MSAISSSGPGASPQLPLQRKAYTASEWSIHAWGLGAITCYFMYEQFYLIFNIHTTVFKVSPVAVGVILALPRLVDGILDPILGHWSDNMSSRWGRRKPFILFAGLLGALLASAIFWMSPDWAQWLKIVMLAFTAVTLFVATGTYDMSHTAMGYELSEEYADRSRVQAIRSVYWGGFSIIGGFVIGLASDPQATGDLLLGWLRNTPLRAVWDWWQSWRPGAAFVSEVEGFRGVSHFISFIMLCALFFPLLWTKERYSKIVSQKKKQHVNLWQALKATLKCRPFVVILITNIARNAGTLPRNLFFFIGTYYVCAGSKADYSNVMGGFNAILGLAFTLLVWWMIKPLTKLIGKRAAFIGGAAAGLIQAVGTWFVATPGNIYGWFLFNVIFMPIGAILGVSTAGIMPDICDLDELEHGERREGLFTAVQSFVNKMEISVMMPLSGAFVAWTGFDADLGAAQPEWVLHRMRWMGFMPLIAVSLIAFITSCFMSITPKQMEQVRAELDSRHAAAGLAVAAVEGGAPGPAAH